MHKANAQADTGTEASPTSFEIQLHHILDLAHLALSGQLDRQSWPTKRVADIYDPEACIASDKTPVLDVFGNDVIARSILVDGEPIEIGSAEFDALEVQVDPDLGLEFDCHSDICKGIIPYFSEQAETSQIGVILGDRGWIRLPIILNDGCIKVQNWCALGQRPECQNKGTYFYAAESRTLLHVRRLQFGRRRHSLQLDFRADSDPICQTVAIWLLESRTRTAQEDAYISMCKAKVE